ncbi:hypothetical protein niasHT_039702 [Heterodera trifolii]|uniref:Uncharacterized protein n=1 Tax=Heterodera trifolii TaxID=157864 RepID=A0ABD2IIM8_9BILA
MLERRSLLEMYADFFAHPDELIAGAYEDTAEKRCLFPIVILAVLKYYLNSFFPARKSDTAKAPYNPILRRSVPLPLDPAWQATVRKPSRHWTVPGLSNKPSYLEHPESSVTCTSHIYTEAYIAGLTSVGIRNIGRATVQLQNHNETYMATFPDAIARNVLGKPWVELAGKVELSCVQTGYSAKIWFQARPLIFGSAHQIHGRIYRRNVAVMQLKGDWRCEIVLKRSARGAFQPFTKCAGEERRAKGEKIF